MTDAHLGRPGVSGLPLVWTRRADTEQVDRYLERIVDPDRAVEALLSLVPFATSADQVDRLLDRAGAAAMALDRPKRRVAVLRVVVETATAAGREERALRLAAEVRPDGVRDHLISAIAGALAARGELDQAVEVARRIGPPRVRERTLVAVAAFADRARALSIGESLTAPARQVEVLVAADPALLDRARAIARRIEVPYERADAVATLAAAVSRQGNTPDALALVRTIAGGRRRRAALLAIVRAAPAAAVRLESAGVDERTAALAEAAAQDGRTEQAITITDAFRHAYDRARTLIRIAVTTAEQGRIDEALRVHDVIDPWFSGVSVLARIAEAAARTGHLARAITMITEPELLRRALGKPVWNFTDVISGARAVAATGDSDGALTIARSLGDSSFSADALAAAAAAAARAGHPDTALRLADAITCGANAVPQFAAAIARARVRAQAATAATTAARGDLTTAVTIAERITDPAARLRAITAIAAHAPPAALPGLTAVVEAGPAADRALPLIRLVALAGDIDRALRLTAVLPPYFQPRALRYIACVVARRGAVDTALGIAPASSALALAVAEGGHLDRALDVTATLDRYERVPAVRTIAAAMAAAGEPDLAHRAVRALPPRYQDQALGAVASAAITHGHHDDAVMAAYALGGSGWRAGAATALARVTAERGDVDRAIVLVRLLANRWRAPDTAMSTIASITAYRGDTDRALALTALIDDPYLRFRAFAQATSHCGPDELRDAAERYLRLRAAEPGRR